MKHCCVFKADDCYFLTETGLYPVRKLYIGFCPICGKPVAELVSVRFDNLIERRVCAGVKANDLLVLLKDSVLYSMKECNYRRFKSKPFGWKYGINKTSNIKGQEKIRQYACDFYGNKELIKVV